MKIRKYVVFFALFAVLLCCISVVSAISNDSVDNVVFGMDSNDECISVSNYEQVNDMDEFESVLSILEEQDNLNVIDEQIMFPIGNEEYSESVDDYDGESFEFQDMQSNNVCGSLLSAEDDNSQDKCILGASKTTIKTKLTVNGITKYYQDGACVYAYLKNSNGKALSGKKITITYDGKTYSRTTDSKGCVEWNVQKTPGTYTIKFSFSASGYQSCSETVKVIVKPIPTSITANNLVFTYGNNNKLDVYLKDNKGKALTNKVVDFNFDGKNYKSTTNNQGLASLTIDSLPKTYSATISFSASNYVTSTKKVTVIINPIPTDLYVDGLICTYNGNNQISAILKSNNNLLSNESVILNINGHTYYSKTDSEGQVSFSFNEEPKLYQATVSFSKDGYVSCSKQVPILVNPIPATLYVDDLTCEYDNDNYLHAYLKTNGKPLSNQEISFSINNSIYKSKTDSNGKVSYKINLKPGEYTCKVSFSNNIYESVTKTVNLKIYSKLVPFEYSLTIPNYVNLTNIWRVVQGYLTPNYIATPGAGGKVKMPLNREYIILTENNQYTYDSQDLKSKNFLININDLSNLRITSNSEYTTFTYSSFIQDDVNQISAIYRQKEYLGMLYPDYEELLIVVNGVTRLSIGFSNPTGWDETGVRFAFINDDLGHNQDVMYCRYDKFNNYQFLRFAETEESVEYSSNMLKISNFPTKEKITTQFKINGTSIIKDEWVSFGKHYDKDNSFEVIQSYAITDKPITKQYDYLLELNQKYPIGAMKASYGTFLTALNTIKMYDDFMGELSDLYNVTAIRDGFAVSMCGVEYGGTAYVHSPDPTMKYTINGDEENVYICRYLSSLFLGEFESYSLECAGIPSISPLDYVFSNIFNKNFTVSTNEGYVIIQIDDNPEYQIRVNSSNGLVYDLSIFNDFLYKGAISCNPNNYCFHDFLTDNFINNVSKKIDTDSIELSKRDIEFLEDALADLALSSAVALIPAIIVSAGMVSFLLPPLALAVGLVVVAYFIKTTLREGDLKAGFGDTLTSFVHSMVLS